MAIFQKKNKALQPIDWPPIADGEAASPVVANAANNYTLHAKGEKNEAGL